MKHTDSPFLEVNFPLTYREDIVGPIINNIKEGNSFSFIGMEDNCKSNVMRFISFREDVQKKYLGNISNKYLFVYVDLNELMTPTIAGFYHLLGLSLIETLKNNKFDFSFLNNIFIDSPEILLKSLKEDFLKIIEKTGKNVVVIFNDFDVCTKGIDIDLIARNLIALRNSARYSISYIFIGLKPFTPKHFFFQKVIYMTPFTGNDAIGVVNRNLERYGVSVSYKEILEVIRLSGGHAGTIKFMIQCLSRHQINIIKNPSHFYDIHRTHKGVVSPRKMTYKHSLTLLSHFQNSIHPLAKARGFLEFCYKDSDILFQCERLLNPLTDIEKAKLQSNQEDKLLINLHLQIKKDGKVKPFSPILEHFLKEQRHQIKPFVYDLENNEIYYFGTTITNNLSLKEFEILKLLIENAGKVFKRDEIMEKIWLEEEYPTDWAFDKLISRLRQKVKDKDGKYIKTIKGVGIFLDQ